MIGDEGAGVWITRAAARLSMSRLEAGAPPGPLGAAMLAASGAQDARGLIAELHARHEPLGWAAMASVVFETAKDDAGSREIIRRAAGELADRVLEVREALGIEGPVVLAGGLLLNQPRLEKAVRESLGVRCVRLEEPPVEGAVRLAQELIRA